ncbi:hypothetical protein Pmar_PMAR015369 [Perkinsus marinus ATCC 50983]|uniref:Uncharacterized protein n=1 Tax=Perkinsus marinus (strain ATCC 50983 / TXsc) TaxID=423536 RepID=C5LGW5_PERM5|nr:hypothetical protein Pmar_PMAR015369 [Perkinsus marinus ATCC 50983]EER04032.1 hypothetical protein Pmar_PMAR015369 [Perkinsus marinus ATCC 50983]|eukprot:XP_002772216.1 hypothetical protein Pmar_PMAR015369 [Perkinsus marinus ATCC 50983]
MSDSTSDSPILENTQIQWNHPKNQPHKQGILTPRNISNQIADNFLKHLEDNDASSLEVRGTCLVAWKDINNIHWLRISAVLIIDACPVYACNVRHNLGSQASEFLGKASNLGCRVEQFGHYRAVDHAFTHN